MILKTEKINGIMLSALILGIFSYVAVRAYFLAITHDECLSFRIVLGDKLVGLSANDHLLNTFLMRVSYYFFGSSELSIRLPNLAGFAVYCIFCFRILMRFKTSILILTGFSLLMLNPYLLDFFSLARGYGLSIGLSAAALYYLFSQETFNSFNHYFKTVALYLGFSLLASFASYICINLNITLLLFAFAGLYFMIKGNEIKLTPQQILKLLGLFAINCLLIFYLVSKLLHLKATGELEFGGEAGFIQDNLTLLILKSIYLSYYGESFWKLLRVFIICLFIAGIVYQFFTKRYNFLTKITIVLFLMVNCLVIQHFGFDSFYPPVRSSLLYVTLFGLFFIGFLDEFAGYLSANLKKIYLAILVLIVVFPLSYNFADNMNITTCIEWHNNANTKSVMEHIRSIHSVSAGNQRKLTISNEWYEEPTINFYKQRYNMLYLEPAIREGIKTNSDFIYCPESLKDSLMLKWNYKLIEHYGNTRTVLLQKNSILQ